MIAPHGEQARRPAVPDRDIIADLVRRFRGFPVPEGGRFNPSIASTEELLAYGLPPKPDPERQPLLYHAWARAFERPIFLREFMIDLEVTAEAAARPFFRQTGGPSFSPSRFETSRNWSGTYITANSNKSFLQIIGSWIVPDILRAPPKANGLPYACSAWIGLDGQRRYFNSSLPQIGTVTTFDPLSGMPPSSQAWTQWWHRDNPDTLPAMIAKSQFPVSPGDRVICSLTALTPRIVRFVIVNLSIIPSPTVPVWAPSPSVTRSNGMVVTFPRISGATAEWIIERPRIPHSADLNNFPDYYSPTDLDLCIAAEGDDVSLASLCTAETRSLQGARFIRMYNTLEQPERSAFISMPTHHDRTAVKVESGDFKDLI